MPWSRSAAGAAVEGVGPGVAVHLVGPGLAVALVVAAAAEDEVGVVTGVEVVRAGVAAHAVGRARGVRPVGATAGVDDVHTGAAEDEVGRVTGDRALDRLLAHRVRLHAAGVLGGVAEDRRRSVGAVDAVAAGAADEELGAVAGTRQDADEASRAERVLRGSGIADGRWRGHDVVVARAAVDLVGTQTSGEHVGSGAAEHLGLLRGGRVRRHEVDRVGAVDGVGARPGVDGVAVDAVTVGAVDVVVTGPVAELVDDPVAPGEDLVVRRPALEDVAAGATHEHGVVRTVERLLVRGPAGRAGPDPVGVGQRAVVGGADGVDATVAGQVHRTEARRDLVVAVGAASGVDRGGVDVRHRRVLERPDVERTGQRGVVRLRGVVGSELDRAVCLLDGDRAVTGDRVVAVADRDDVGAGATGHSSCRLTERQVEVGAVEGRDVVGTGAGVDPRVTLARADDVVTAPGEHDGRLGEGAALGVDRGARAAGEADGQVARVARDRRPRRS